MATLDHFAHVLLGLLAALAALVLGALSALEAWMGGALRQIGVPPDVQAVLGIVVAVLFLVAALRLFGGIIRAVLIFLLVVVLVHALAHIGAVPAPHPTHI